MCESEIGFRVEGEGTKMLAKIVSQRAHIEIKQTKRKKKEYKDEKEWIRKGGKGREV